MIVAAIDDTEQAKTVLAEADTLAQQFDDTIHAIHVMERSEAIQGLEKKGQGLETDELQARAEETAAKILEANSTSADAEPVGRIGAIPKEITKYADESDARYIVVSPKRKSKTGKLILGSVTQTVLLSASSPVVSLGRGAVEYVE